MALQVASESLRTSSYGLSNEGIVAEVGKHSLQSVSAVSSPSHKSSSLGGLHLYTGPFEANTSFPILLVGNINDPILPVAGYVFRITIAHPSLTTYLSAPSRWRKASLALSFSPRIRLVYANSTHTSHPQPLNFLRSTLASLHNLSAQQQLYETTCAMESSLHRERSARLRAGFLTARSLSILPRGKIQRLRTLGAPSHLPSAYQDLARKLTCEPAELRESLLSYNMIQRFSNSSEC